MYDNKCWIFLKMLELQFTLILSWENCFWAPFSLDIHFQHEMCPSFLAISWLHSRCPSCSFLEINEGERKKKADAPSFYNPVINSLQTMHSNLVFVCLKICFWELVSCIVVFAFCLLEIRLIKFMVTLH